MRLKILSLALIIITSFSCRKSDFYLLDEEVIHDNGAGTGTITWKADKTYILDGFVFVNDGQVLTIEAGTLIQAKTGQGSLASALIISRGGKIIAEGESDNPIIFTVEGDDLEGSVPLDASGLWGGLIILGNAPVTTSSGESFIEGLPISEPRGIFGGSYTDDNSGILKYVSIRHGGTNIGEGNEINGLTLGGVGNKTIIDHIEVISNADDGIEFFGGSVNCSNLAVAFCGDDAFDFDDGFTGKCQFLLGISDEVKGDHIAEHSGFSSSMQGSGISVPDIYNVTFIGRHPSSESPLISFSEEAGGIYKNSIFLNSESGVAIEYGLTGSSYKRWENGEIELSGNLFYNISLDEPDGVFFLMPYSESLSEEQNLLSAYFSNAGNEIKDPGFMIQADKFHLLPSNTVFDNLAEYNSTWFQQVSYKGAFGSNNWLEGWSYLWNEGVIY